MAQAYDFALEKMGMDFASYTIWNDYILFLKGVDAAGSYAENQKISAIRKIYHRGVKIPMLNVEILWYDNEFILSSLLSFIHFSESSVERKVLRFESPDFLTLSKKNQWSMTENNRA